MVMEWQLVIKNNFFELFKSINRFEVIVRFVNKTEKEFYYEKNGVVNSCE